MEMAGDVRVAGSQETTRGKILATARELFSDFGYLGVSMSDISKRLDITKAALYHHFSGKAEIYGETLSDVVRDLTALLREVPEADGPEQQLHGMIRVYLTQGLKEKNLVNALAGRLPTAEVDLREVITSARAGLAEMFVPVIERLAHVARLSRIDSPLVARMLTAMMDGLILESSFMEARFDPGQVASQIVKLIGLGSEGAECQ